MKIATMKTRASTLARLAAVAAIGGSIGACATTPPPCPTEACAPCEDANDGKTEGPKPPPALDLRARDPELDRGRSLSLEAMSADGKLALFDVYDSARGRGFQVVDIASGKTTKTFEIMALGERTALKQGMKALGASPASTWSSENAAQDARAFVAESGGRLVVFVESTGTVREVAILPRHESPGATRGSTVPAPVSGVTVVWTPDEGHLLVIYRQTTVDTPSVRADRWFSIPVGK